MYVNLHKAIGAVLWGAFAVVLAVFGYKAGKKVQKHKCDRCG